MLRKNQQVVDDNNDCINDIDVNDDWVAAIDKVDDIFLPDAAGPRHLDQAGQEGLRRYDRRCCSTRSGKLMASFTASEKIRYLRDSLMRDNCAILFHFSQKGQNFNEFFFKPSLMP